MQFKPKLENRSAILWSALTFALSISVAHAQPPATVATNVPSLPPVTTSAPPPAPLPTPAIVLERDFYHSTFKAHLLLERYVPQGAMLFFGDSLIQNLEIESLHRYPVNFGITGDTTAGLLHRLKQYKSVQMAETVVLESGVNDLGFGSKFDKKIIRNYARMLAFLPPAQNVYLIGIFPINETVNPEFAGYNNRIRMINKGLAQQCTKHPRCVFISVGAKLAGKDGNTKKRYLRSKDAVHLNDAGMSIVLDELRKKLKTAPDDAGEPSQGPEQTPQVLGCPS